MQTLVTLLYTKRTFVCVTNNMGWVSGDREIIGSASPTQRNQDLDNRQIFLYNALINLILIVSYRLGTSLQLGSFLKNIQREMDSWRGL